MLVDAWASLGMYLKGGGGGMLSLGLLTSKGAYKASRHKTEDKARRAKDIALLDIRISNIS